ncbi:MAG: sensor histidine kinase, partial [Bdellovibrionota bacterium]
MASEKLFQRRLVIGYLITLALSAVIAAASIGLLHRVAASKDLVIYDYAQDLIYAQKLRQTGERQFVSFRGYMISRDPVLLQEFNSRRATFRSQLSDLRKISRHPDVLRLLDQIERADSDYNRGDAELLKKIRAGVKFQALETDFEKNIRPLRRLLEQNLNALIDLKQQDLERAKAESERSTYRSLELIVLVAGVALILAAGLAWILTRTLSRLYHSAVRATQLREEVLGIVAHDLRNPLSSIRLNSQVLERLSRSEASSRGKLATVAGAIERSADRMNRLIEDLLDFGKIESGHLRLELRTEDVSSLIQDALEALEPGAKAAGVRLTPELGESLGELVCDRDRIF